MRLISGKEQEEFEYLRNRYEMDLTRESLSSVDLEHDIDEPIRSVVMGLSLLGCNTMWSCCGFDYAGQPIRKCHDYGTIYVAFEHNQNSSDILDWFFNRTNTPFKETWGIRGSLNDGVKTNWLSNKFTGKLPVSWDYTNVIHYSELAATRIRYFEHFLIAMSGKMSESYTMVDQNKKYRTRFKFWQYPPKEPWTFTKEQFMTRVHA